MIPISHAQRSKEWHDWRSSGVGGSESGSIAAAIGLLPQPASWMLTIQQLWEMKVGLRPAIKVHPGMLRGIEFEDDAVENYFLKTGISTSPICGTMQDCSHVIASFDGITFDGSIVLEAKIPSQEVIDLAANGVVVPYYEPQCAHQALVAWGHPDQWPTDAEHHFFAYQPETNTGHLVARPASYYKSLASNLLIGIDSFWKNVTDRLPPCGDPWLQAAIQYRIVKAEFEKLKALEDIAKKNLLDLMPQNVKTFSGGGVTLTKSTKAGVISYADYVKSINVEPEKLEPFRGESSPTVRVTVEKKVIMPELSEAVQLAIGATIAEPADPESASWNF